MFNNPKNTRILKKTIDREKRIAEKNNEMYRPWENLATKSCGTDELKKKAQSHRKETKKNSTDISKLPV